MDLSKLAEQVGRLTTWASAAPSAMIERWEPQRLTAVAELCSDLQRLAAADRSELAICFLGSSGVGKSTLINSLVDPRLQVVPQGGIGPLTAQATMVRYSAQPYLHATYHGPRRVNQLVFALDRYSERQRGLARQSVGVLDAADEREIELALPAADAPSAEPAEASLQSRINSYVSQARQLVTGRQFGSDELSTEYFADCLRSTLGHPARWGFSPLPEHAPFLTQVAEAIAIGDGGKRWEQADDNRVFLAEVARHAMGSIAPLINSLDVGWPAQVLRDGLVLVDLPGIGIANDEYRSVTSAWIRRATAVVLVVDKSGVTEASADLLRTTGFLNSILHRPPESTSVSPLLRVVAVKLDDVANAARATFKTQNPGVVPPAWLAQFRSACKDSQELIRNQLEQVFGQSLMEAPTETKSERRDALEQIVSSMEVYPVSAVEYRKLHEDDPEDAPKIKVPEDSNIPALTSSLSALAHRHRDELIDAYRSATQRLFDSLERALARVKDELSGDEQQVACLEKLRSELDAVIAPAADELKPRLGALRERLRGTIPKVIENEVERAIRAADKGIRDYLQSLNKLHWATLLATIRRGGIWVRSRPIDLPNELALRFEEPLAVAWSRGVVGTLRNALKEFSSDIGRLLGKVVTWASTQAGLDVAHVQRFRSDVEAEVASLASRGEIAAADLTKLAKQQLQAGIQDEIRAACQEFVKQHLHVGQGVKNRVIQFLDQLVPRVAQVARTTAGRFLRESYDSVLSHVSTGLKRFDDPLAHAKMLLLGGQERVAQDAAQRVNELDRVRAILAEMAELQTEVSEVCA
jgi:GTP-binding protein EngB required for normal cell division